jgi:hypothetical protein
VQIGNVKFSAGVCVVYTVTFSKLFILAKRNES